MKRTSQSRTKSRALWGYSIQWLLKDKWRVCSTILGVALGIAIFVATLLAHRSVEKSFARTVELFGGGGWWELTSGGAPFSDQIVKDLKLIDDGLLIVPLLSRGAVVKCNKTKSADSQVKSRGSIERVEMLGVDALSIPALFSRLDGSIFSSNDLLELISSKNIAGFDARLRPCGSKTGQSGELELPVLEINSEDTALKVQFLVEVAAETYKDPVILRDISWVQDQLSLPGQVTRVYVKPLDSHQEMRVKTLARVAGLNAQAVADRAAKFSKITEAFRTNLLFLSSCALLIAGYLIHILLSFWCLKRQSDARILRCLGVSAHDIVWLVLSEALFLGVVGTLLGLTLGWGLGRGMESIVGQTVNALYMRVPVGTLTLEWWIVPLVLALGVGVTLLSSYRPAVYLSKASLSDLRVSVPHKPLKGSIFKDFFLGVFFIAGSLSSALIFRSVSVLSIGLVTPILYLIGSILLVKPILARVLLFLQRCDGRLPFSTVLAIDNLSLAFTRTVSAVTALMISAGLFISIDLMVTSFSGSLDVWLNQILKADVFISLDDNSQNGAAEISLNQIQELTRIAGVSMVDTVAVRVLDYRGRPYQLTGVSFEVLEREKRMFVVEKAAEVAIVKKRLPVFVSEPFARWHAISAGDTLNLKVGSSILKGRVRAIFRDYTTEQGVVMIDSSVFSHLPGATPIRSASLYLKTKTQIPEVMAKARAINWSGKVVFRSQESLRAEIFKIFNATFQVTEGLMWITLLVSLWVVANTITIMVTERRNELETLRTLGASQRAIGWIISLEAGILGLWGVAGSILTGSGLALLLVYVVNPFFFGWTLTPHWSWRVLGTLLIGVPMLTGLVGWCVALLHFGKVIKGTRYE
jgi:putative ABC transport system permease protein